MSHLLCGRNSTFRTRGMVPGLFLKEYKSPFSRQTFLKCDYYRWRYKGNIQGKTVIAFNDYVY